MIIVFRLLLVMAIFEQPNQFILDFNDNLSTTAHTSYRLPIISDFTSASENS